MIEKMIINNCRKAMLDNIQALDKKTLQQELESHLKLEFAYKDEIDRLNNIIDELEKYLKEQMEYYRLDVDTYVEYKMTLDKLKELKEGK